MTAKRNGEWAKWRVILIVTVALAGLCTFGWAGGTTYVDKAVESHEKTWAHMGSQEDLRAIHLKLDKLSEGVVEVRTDVSWLKKWANGKRSK